MAFHHRRTLLLSPLASTPQESLLYYQAHLLSRREDGRFMRPIRSNDIIHSGSFEMIQPVPQVVERFFFEFIVMIGTLINKNNNIFNLVCGRTYMFYMTYLDYTILSSHR